MTDDMIASLTAEQMRQLRQAEEATGLVLIAYEPGREAQDQARSRDGEDAVLDAIVDDYRTYDRYLP